jgi:hypothetical protein
MREAFTLRLTSLDDAQHTVMFIDMLDQFAHGGTISAPTDKGPAVRVAGRHSHQFTKAG